MPISRKLLVSSENKLKIGANSDQPADKNCCCGPIVCPGVILSCDATSVVIFRCGFSPYHKFLCVPPYTDLGVGTEYTFTGCSAEFGDCADSLSGDDDGTKLYLTQTSTRSGSAADEDCDTGCETCGTQTIVQAYNPDTCEIEEVSNEGEVACCDPFFGCPEEDPMCEDPLFLSHPVTGSDVLTEEYTDELLFSNAESILPDYPGTFSFSDGGCVAGSGFLNEEQSQYAYTKIRYKFRFDPPSGCKIIFFWNETFIPNDPPFTPVPSAKTWTWDHGVSSGSGSPNPTPFSSCSSPPCCRGDDDDFAVIESDIFEIAPAANVNGSYIITDIRWSLSSGYTPPVGNPDISGGAAGHVTYAFGPNCSAGSDNFHF